MRNQRAHPDIGLKAEIVEFMRDFERTSHRLEGEIGDVASRAQRPPPSVMERLSAVETKLMHCIVVSERLLHKVDGFVCVVCGLASALTEN